MKNILLVMSSSGYLVAPSVDPTHEKLWVETWKRLSRFLPDLRKELDLDPPVAKPEPEKPPQEEDSTPPVAPVS